MIQRVLFGALALALLVALFQLDRGIALRAMEASGPVADLIKRGSVVPLLFLVVLLLGAREMNRLFRARGIRTFSLLAYLIIAGMLLLPWLSPAGLLGDRIADREGLYWPLVGVLFSFLGIGVACVLRGNPSECIRDGGATLLMTIYLGFLGSFGLQIRCGVDSPQQWGVWLLLIVILITKCSDIGAYFVGSAIGRHKLIPRVSPGKSVEGAIGGILGSSFAALVLASANNWMAGFGIVDTRIGTTLREMLGFFGPLVSENPVPHYIKAAAFGATMSVFAQCGDLLESCLKRDVGIKDSGTVMPHYGGFLDLVDSPVFTMPVAWFLVTRVWNMV